jgi:hypothetical protein
LPLVFLSLAALLWARPAPGCDSTGCLMATRGASGVLKKGSFNLDFSYRYLDESEKLRGSDDAELVLRPRVDFEHGLLIPGYHQDLDGKSSVLQLEAAYGAGTATTLYLSAPLMTRKSHDIAHGGVVTAYDTWGFGDVVVGVREGLALPFAGQATGSFALKLPTGATDVIDPYDQKIQDPTLQPGTGSLDALLSVQYGKKLASPRLDVSLTGSYQANTTNDRHYRFGNEGIATLGVARPLGSSWSVSTSLKWVHQGRDRFLGQDVLSTGSKFLYVTGGVRFFAGAFSYYAVAQFPIYSYVNESQLGPKAGVLAGLSRAF